MKEKNENCGRPERHYVTKRQTKKQKRDREHEEEKIKEKGQKKRRKSDGLGSDGEPKPL